MSRVLTRRHGGLAVFSAVAALLAVGMSWNMAPSAKAESGRRICIYVKDEPGTVKINVDSGGGVKTPATVPAKVYLVADYKKRGACPNTGIENTLRLADGDHALSFQQPVPKKTCEDWIAELYSINNPFGENVDVCTQMQDDVIYRYKLIEEDRLNATIDPSENIKKATTDPLGTGEAEIPVKKGTVVVNEACPGITWCNIKQFTQPTGDEEGDGGGKKRKKKKKPFGF